jgi:hypothetical protein
MGFNSAFKGLNMFVVHFKVQSQHASDKTEKNSTASVKITASLADIQTRVKFWKLDTKYSAVKICTVRITE